MDAARRKKLGMVASQLSIQQAELESLRDDEQMDVDAMPEGEKADAAQAVLDDIDTYVSDLSSMVDKLNEVVENDEA